MGSQDALHIKKRSQGTLSDGGATKEEEEETLGWTGSWELLTTFISADWDETAAVGLKVVTTG